MLQKFLFDYPNKDDAKILAEGFQNRFRLNYSGPVAKRTCKNLLSVQQNPVIALDKIMKEVSLGRIAGPFKTCPIDNLVVSPIGLVPKGDGAWRLIQHLSYPAGSSINDFIDSDLCSVNYTSLDEVIYSIVQLGKNCQMGKMDVKSAFRLLPIHPDDFCLLGIQLQGMYFFDKMLPMGCALSCALWEKFATFLEWLVKHLYPDSCLHHYLDDFIFLGGQGTGLCLQTMSNFEQLCALLGVPLAEDKTAGPASILVFLGLELNSISFRIQIPADKLAKLKSSLTALLGKKKVTLKELQSLVGLLNFCTRAIPVARAFNRRFYDTMAGLTKPFHHIRLTVAIKADVLLWLSFLQDFNGFCSFPELDWNTNETLNLYTDSAGSPDLGCATVFGVNWVYFPWPKCLRGTTFFDDITVLELVPILLAFSVWWEFLRTKKLILYVDNQALVSILNKKSSRSKLVMHLIRPLVILCMLNSIQYKAVHIQGSSNEMADSLSRCQWERFKQVAPDVNATGQEVPATFVQLISSLKSVCS